MFIVFGSPRSGTTLLKESLNQNPAIVIPHETDFIVPAAFLIDRVRIPDVGRKLLGKLITSTNDFAPSIGRYLSAEEVERCVEQAEYTLPSILERIYASIAKKRGALIAGDKSPNDLGSFGILRKSKLFESNIKIVHIVRDVRDVVLSLKKTSWAPADIEQFFPGIWGNSNLNLRRFSQSRPGNYFYLRYEDFIQAPHVLLRNLCEFLQVPFSDRMLEWQSLGHDLRHLPHHRNLGQPPREDRRYGWKNLNEHQSFSWAARANEALHVFGYDPAD